MIFYKDTHVVSNDIASVLKVLRTGNILIDELNISLTSACNNIIKYLPSPLTPLFSTHISSLPYPSTPTPLPFPLFIIFLFIIICIIILYLYVYIDNEVLVCCDLIVANKKEYALNQEIMKNLDSIKLARHNDIIGMKIAVIGSYQILSHVTQTYVKNLQWERN